MDAMDSGDESYHDPTSTQMLEDIRVGIQYHPNINRIEARYKIRDYIKQIKSEWKVALGLRKILLKFYTRCLRLL